MHRTGRVNDEYLGEAIRQVIAHEIGRALGLPHNMKANVSYPVDFPSITDVYPGVQSLSF